MSGPLGASQWMYNNASGFYDYKIDQSLRFDIARSTNLTRTAGSPSDGKKATWSWWMKKSDVVSDTSVSYKSIFYSGSPNSDGFSIAFMRYGGYHYHELIVKQDNGGSASHMFLYTDAFYRDVSSWYHFVVRYDSTDSTAADRIKIYVNGTQQAINTSGTNVNPSLNHIPSFQVSGKTLRIGEGRTDSNEHIGGYLAEVNFIDGQALTPSSFGETKDGIWVAKDSSGLTFGNNGFYLPFDDPSAIGDDESPNTNDFTANNFSAHDVVLDSPTNNFCTLNPLTAGTFPVLKDGNLAFQTLYSADLCGVASTWYPNTGKWYWEVHNDGTSTYPYLGISDQLYTMFNATKGSFYSVAWTRDGNGEKYDSVYSGTITEASLGGTWGSNDIVQFALDCDARKLWIGKNNTWFNSGDPANGTSQNASWTLNTHVSPMFMGYASFALGTVFNFGQDGSFSGNLTGGNIGTATDENRVGAFKYAPPSGFLAMASSNLPEPEIIDGTEHFNTVLYTGTGANRSISGLGFSPDFVWVKERSSTSGHILSNSVAGATKLLTSNTTDSEQTDANKFSSFDSDGFSVGTSGAVNANGDTYVGWNWLAGGSAVSNTDGSITSQVSANTKAGFSVVSYAGNNVTGATVGHSLGVEPSLIIVKSRTGTAGYGNWGVYHKDLGATKAIYLNTTGAQSTAIGPWNNTAPTNTVFSLGNDGGYGYQVTGQDYIAYCFHSVESYSKVGSYTGNGNANGMFVYTGFRPAFTIIKRVDATQKWGIQDAVREPSNEVVKYLEANGNYAEVDNYLNMDYLSNGFKLRRNEVATNASGGTYIYIAFAESPFKFANAR